MSSLLILLRLQVKVDLSWRASWMWSSLDEVLRFRDLRVERELVTSELCLKALVMSSEMLPWSTATSRPTLRGSCAFVDRCS